MWVKKTTGGMMRHFSVDSGHSLKKRKPDPIDDQGHGTHCTGSVLGTKGIGVAPGAQWLSCKALNRMGSGTQSGLLKCMEFALCPTDYNGENADCDKKPHIVSNSWGSNSDEVGKEYEDAIDAWRKADIIPVFAAGNSGDECSTMGSPGASKNVIAVGATNNEDAIADFSSRGPVTKGGLTKPEISAPGVDIYSAGHRSDTAYATMSGTSMACPHVAGMIALQLQQNPDLKYQNILDNLSKNAEKEKLLKGVQQCGNKKQGDFPNNHFGNGRIDAPKTLSL
jgi:subtilisin family serine protease